MDPRVAPLAEILRLNTRLLNNCLTDLTEEQCHYRPSPTANSAAYVAAHMVESRYYLLKAMGQDRTSPLGLGWKGIDDVTEWPSLDEIRAAWADVSKALDQRLTSMTPADIDTPSDSQMPFETRTLLGFLGFLVQHDSYHLGQASLLRKSAGLPAMSYS